MSSLANFANLTNAVSVNPSALRAVTPLPSAIYQFLPHQTLGEMASRFAQLEARGYDAVQMAPIHPPGRDEFITPLGVRKVGSVYAPRDHHAVSPILYRDDITRSNYLQTDTDGVDRAEGWVALRKFAGEAHRHSLRVVADIVFGHTSHDPEVMAAHLDRFGPDFYESDNEGHYVTPGGRTEDGRWDGWVDVVQINHMGPAHDAIVAHFSGLLEKFMEAGVNVFRADAAYRIPAQFWAKIIEGARVYAEGHNLPRPAFYAEALGCDPKIAVQLVSTGGFDGVTSSTRWWKGSAKKEDRWWIEQYRDVRMAGGGSVSFMDTHDTERAVSTFPGNDLYTRMAMVTLLSPTTTVLAGTESRESRQPSVFVDRFYPPADGPDARILALEGFLLGIKTMFPIFRTPAHTEVIDEGSNITVVRKATPYEEVLIVINNSLRSAKYWVPPAFKEGLILNVSGNVFSGAPDLPVSVLSVAGHGAAVFRRALGPDEKVNIPPPAPDSVRPQNTLQ